MKTFPKSVLMTGFLALAFLNSCASQEHKPDKITSIEYSSFSGLREYGKQNGYEVLSPQKLQNCMQMQAGFAAQKHALHDLQMSIDLQRSQIEQQNQQIRQIKAEIESVETPELIKRDNYKQHNQLVQNYNDKVNNLQKKLTGYNHLLEKYNQMSMDYNAGVAAYNETCALNKMLYPQDLDRVAVHKK